MRFRKEIDSSSQIKTGAVMAYITIAVNILIGLIYTPWMVQNIGQSNYGLYTLALSLINMFVMDFGLSTAVVRFLSKYNAIHDQKSINNLLGIVYKLFLVIDSLITLCLVIAFFFIGSIYKELTIQELEKLKVVFIISAVYSVAALPFSTFNGILVSYEKFIYQKACDLFYRIFNVLLIIIALSMGLGLYALVTMNALSGILTILLKYTIIRKKTPVKVNFRYQNKIMLKEIFGFSIWSTIISIADRFIFNIIPTILGAFAGAVSIANFGVASSLEGYVYTFSTAINGMFLPKVSRIVAKREDNDDLLSLMIKVGRIQFVIIGLLLVGFLSIGNEFITLWMGKNFEVSFYCTVFMILPSILELTQQIANITIFAVNKVRLLSYVYIGTALINILLSIILSRFMGELGASISICTAFIFRCLAMNIIYYKVLRINVFTFFKQCHLKMGAAFFISLLLLFRISVLVPIGGWLGLFVKVVIITVIYSVINWLLALNQYEKSLVRSMAKKILHAG